MQRLLCLIALAFFIIEILSCLHVPAKKVPCTGPLAAATRISLPSAAMVPEPSTTARAYAVSRKGEKQESVGAGRRIADDAMASAGPNIRHGDMIEIKLEGGAGGSASDSSSNYKSQAGMDQDIELVQLWLRDLGSRSAVMKQFREQQIDVEALAVMHPQQLALLGVTKVGLQSKLISRAALEMKNRRRNPAYLFDALYETKDSLTHLGDPASVLSRIAAAPSVSVDSSFVYFDAAGRAHVSDAPSNLPCQPSRSSARTASAPLYTVEPRNAHLLPVSHSFAATLRPSQSSSAQFWKHSGRTRSVDDRLAANLAKVRQLQVARKAYRNQVADLANRGAGKISEEDFMQDRLADCVSREAGVSPVFWEKRQGR